MNETDFWIEVMAQEEAYALDNAGEAEREAAWAGAGFSRRNEESAEQENPSHNYNMPHDVRYGDDDARDCPPNCPYRLWVTD